jgi:dolichyl-phosphate-mannose--protein O-mannosyl transferase
MAGHVLDHFFFGSPTRSERVKWVWFAIWAGSLIVSFFWFKDLAFGLYGPITDIKGYQWRSSWNVSAIEVGQADFYRSTTRGQLSVQKSNMETS